MNSRPTTSAMNEHLTADPLARFRFQPQERAALTRQGFVAAEHRGSRTYYKLRFRCAGRQVVRYLRGADEAAAVEAEVLRLHERRRLQRTLDEMITIGRQLLRSAREELQPLVAARGWQLHGRSVRQPRPAHAT